MSSDEQLARSQLRCGFIEVIKSLKGRYENLQYLLSNIQTYLNQFLSQHVKDLASLLRPFLHCFRKAEIVTCEGNTLDCNFIGVDRSVENIAVENLRTPTNFSLPQAIIRTQDTDKVKLV